MFCSKCGTEAADGAEFCSKCGQNLTTPDPAPAAPTAANQPPTTVVVNANPYGTPGTGALWLSIFGFVCLIPAVIGIILGFSALREAKRRGVSGVKAGWAIGIGLAWIVPSAIFWFAILGGVTSSTTSSTESAPTPSETSVQEEPATTEAEQPSELIDLVEALEESGFKCTPPGGTLQLVQCTKGEVEVENYGKQPAQTINIEYSTGSVSGFAKAKTLKLIGEYVSVDDYGDDGTGSGTSLFGSS